MVKRVIQALKPKASERRPVAKMFSLPGCLAVVAILLGAAVMLEAPVDTAVLETPVDMTVLETPVDMTVLETPVEAVMTAVPAEAAMPEATGGTVISGCVGLSGSGCPSSFYDEHEISPTDAGSARVFVSAAGLCDSYSMRVMLTITPKYESSPRLNLMWTQKKGTRTAVYDTSFPTSAYETIGLGVYVFPNGSQGQYPCTTYDSGYFWVSL